MTELAEALIERFTAWAKARDDIRGAILIGSQARTDRPADEWSDVDLLVLTTDVPALLRSGDWVAEMGPVVLTFLESTVATGITERRALYESGLEADYAILPSTILDSLTSDHDDTQSQTLRALVAAIFRRGFRVVLDKDGQLDRLGDHAQVPAPPTRPDAAQFTNESLDFWFHALWTARKLRRGELMMAKSCCDGVMKGNVLTMARWHAAAGGIDPWHQSRFFEEWADPRLVRDLHACYAHYDEVDIARALRNTMRTFDWLARETADRFGFDYPDRAAQWVTARVEETLAIVA